MKKKRRVITKKLGSAGGTIRGRRMYRSECYKK